MRNRRPILGCIVVALALGSTDFSAAHAATVSRQHVRGRLTVDGASDLHGVVRARGGLRVTAGLNTDSLTVTGPATTNGLNAGAGAITTSAALQGGSLSVAGDAGVGGGLTVTRGVSAGWLHVTGPLDSVSAAVTGALSAGSISTQGAVTGGSATFNALNVSPGGSINFNNASITGVSGLTLGGSASLSSLQLAPAAGAAALTITQGGKSGSLLLDANGTLTVSGTDLTVQKDLQTTNALVNGTILTSNVSSTSTLTLHAPTVTTSQNLDVGSGGNLKLIDGSNGGAHLVGNRDSRGTCTMSANAGSVNTCSISFSRPYGAVPIVVVTPVGSAPGLVTGFSVQSGMGGFSILFTVTQAASVSFNYMVQQ